MQNVRKFSEQKFAFFNSPLQLFLISTIFAVPDAAIFELRLRKKNHTNIRAGISPTEVARCVKRNVAGHPASLCVRACMRAKGRREKKERQLFAATHEDSDRLLFCLLLFPFHVSILYALSSRF